MCGIAGILTMDGRKVEDNWLNTMAGKMIHRGPDGEGIWRDTHIGFVHRRLSIIDLKTGDQPLSNEDGSVWVVFNGEIYNFRELREELELKGHLFKTSSDTEVLVHGYEEWGKEMLPRLNGMFSFALWNIRDGKLLLARDRLGVKPLYYYLDKNLLIFASELQAMMACHLLPGEIDTKAFELYLHYQYVPSPLSIYKNVFKLNPSHWLEVDSIRKRVSSAKYWEIDLHQELDESKGLREWAEIFEELIKDAVRIRLYSDVPFGAFLSGGTDSGLTVALMSKMLSYPVRTFSMGWEGGEGDELSWAAQVANKFSTTHEVFRVTPEELEIIPKICPHFGEPFADSSAIPTYYVSKMAGSKVKMVLSGDGGDEIFGGYLTYQTLLSARRFDALVPRVFLKAAPLSPSHRLQWWLKFISSSWEERHDLLMSHFTLEERRKLLGNQGAFSELGHLARMHPIPHKDPMLKTQHLDLKTYLPDDVLVKVDRMSMANSLEVRSPLLDYRLAEAAFSMPTSMKIPKPSRDGRSGKFILKELASVYLGRKYVYRPKQGFGIPIDRWLRYDRKGYMTDTLLSPSSPIYDYVDRTFIDSMVREHQSGRLNHCAKLWNLLMLDGWLRYVYQKNTNSVG
jgi:asparagine synthase (glutamine-hydrolysing)